MPKIWCEHAIMNAESIVTVELCCSLKICHIHNVLNMAIPQTSKIFSAYLSKQTICIYMIIRCLWVISVCVRDSFFFQKTVILKFALSRTSRNTPALIISLFFLFHDHLDSENVLITTLLTEMVNMKSKNILLFNSDKVDIKTKTNKLLHSVRDVWNNLLESFSNEYFKLHSLVSWRSATRAKTF